MIISGSGGVSTSAPSQRRTARIDPDNIGNNTILEVLDLLSEGEIEGFPSARKWERGSDNYNWAALKDVFLDLVPVLNSNAQTNDKPNDGAYNFRRTEFRPRYGERRQSPIKLTQGPQREYTVNQVVTKSTPVARRIVDPGVNLVRIVLIWQQLQIFFKDGDIKEDRVEFQIKVAYEGGPFEVVREEVVSGRSADPFTRDYIIELDDNKFPVDIRIERLTADPNKRDGPGDRKNEFSWFSYSEIKSLMLEYPSSAYVALQLDARDVSSVPVRTYRIRGIKVKIPDNATVDQNDGHLEYSGIWTGNFGPAQWTTDPAWCLWDLLTERRYGCGDRIKKSNLDKYTFYAISQYCAEMVPTGDGREEPRFALNVNIQTPEEAYKVINNLCSVFRGMPYWSTGSVALTQDKPQDVSRIFTQAQVENGDFQYSGSSLSERRNAASVEWQNLEEQENDFEIVEDASAIAKYGLNVAEITAIGCTSQSQARRVGRAIIATEQTETETVTFTPSIGYGSDVRPGMVIGTSDPLRWGARHGGRIVNATENTVTLDCYIEDLPVVQSPKIRVSLADGRVNTRTVVDIRENIVTVASPFGSEALIGGTFVYGDAIELWRVLAVEEEDGVKYKITAISYNPAKYAYIDKGSPLRTRGFGASTAPAVAVDPGEVIVTGGSVEPFAGEAAYRLVAGAVAVASGGEVATIDSEVAETEVDSAVINVSPGSVSGIDPTMALLVEPGQAICYGGDVSGVDPEALITIASSAATVYAGDVIVLAPGIARLTIDAASITVSTAGLTLDSVATLPVDPSEATVYGGTATLSAP